MGYTKKSIKGFAWLGANRVIIRGISLLRIAILARILSPLQFGIFGIASIMLDILEIFTETGINIILIQNKENSDKYISTAWIVSIFRGFVIFSFIFVSAPFISVFFNAPMAKSIIQLISFVALFVINRFAFLRTTWVRYSYIFGKKMERQCFRNGL